MLAALLAAATLLTVGTRSAPAAAADSSTSTGLTLVGDRAIAPRLHELTVRTSAVPGDLNVRVLLPVGYDREEARRWPVVYALHGSTGDASMFTESQQLIPLAQELPAIVVMPDGGDGGEYTDWVSPKPDGTIRHWETFHVRQLLPFIDQRYRTKADRSARAVMGISMGGLGTMEYASRHPDLFGAAYSISGAVSLTSVIGAIGVTFNEALENVPPGTIYGPRATAELNWRAHSPIDLSMNLSNTIVFFSSYNGRPGGCDATNPDPSARTLEMGTFELSQELHATLSLQKLPHTWRDLGNGTHTAPCFDNQIALAIKDLGAALAAPAPAPRSIDYVSAAPTWTQWGWTVDVDRAADEFSGLRGAGPAGFQLFGSGTATVRTPAVYQRGGRYRVSITRSERGEPGAATLPLACPPEALDCLPAATAPPYTTRNPLQSGEITSLVLTADRNGRLTVPVPLGTANTTREYATPGDNNETIIYQSSVTVQALQGRDAQAPATSPRTEGPAAAKAAPGLPATGAASTGSATGALLLLLALLLHRRHRDRHGRPAPSGSAAPSARTGPTPPSGRGRPSPA